MSYKLLLPLILTFFCCEIIGQTSSKTTTSESQLPIDSVINNTFNTPLELPEINYHNKIAPSLTLPSSMRLENSFSHNDYKQIPYLNIVNRASREKPFFPSQVTPFNYHFENPVEGGDLVGFNINLISTPIIGLFISPRISSSFMGSLFPTRINNASLKADFVINAGDYIRFKLVGQISANQGINPLLNPRFGASNYFGGAVQVRVAGDFGLEASVHRNYYMGKWTTSYSFTPVLFK